MAELTRDQKIFLIQKVDCFALSSMRKEALKGYAKLFPITEEEISLISDFVYIQESAIREIAAL